VTTQATTATANNRAAAHSSRWRASGWRVHARALPRLIGRGWLGASAVRPCGRGQRLVRGVAVVITDPGQGTLILQRKDRGYPVRRYRGALTCFGGQIEAHESPDEAVHRELVEEIIDQPLQAAVLAALRPVEQVLTGHGHHVWIYAAVLPDLAAHASRIQTLPRHRVCAEGILEVHQRAGLAGQRFAWDADALLRAHLRPIVGEHSW
jgi:ADP-ribose pyrophosphatase YjhB (NUDIX family)